MEEVRDSIDYSEYSFIIEFPTCNSFRQVLEFLNQSHKTIPLIFSKDKFSIRKPNDSETLFFDGCIYSHNLTMYYVNPEELENEKCKLIASGDEESEPEIYIHVPVVPLLSSLKRCQKKQKIRIFRMYSNESFITIQTEESSSIRIDPSRDPPSLLISDNPIPLTNPNLTTQLSSFHYSATGCGRISDKVSKLQIYKKGLRIMSSSAQGESKIERGICEGAFLCEINIPGDVLKSISKLSSLCDEGIVRIYCNDSLHIRLEIPISVIGTAHIYLFPNNR